MKLKETINSYLNSESEEQRIEKQKAVLMFRFVNIIDTYMKENNIKRKDLANKLEVSESYISQIFSLDKSLNFNILSKISYHYNIEFDISISESRNQPNKNKDNVSQVDMEA